MKKRFLSLFLAILMFTSVFAAFPPLSVGAGDIIDEVPELTSPECGSLRYLSSVSKYAYADEDITSESSYKLKWDDVADYYTVYVKALDNAPDPGDEEPGELLYNKQASDGFSKNYLTISKSNLEDCVGKYIKVSIQGKNKNGDNTVRCDYYIYVEEPAPSVEDIDAYVRGTEVEFWVETNLAANFGIMLFADGYKLGMIEWEKEKFSSGIDYTGFHTFNQAGEREITVYALDKYGDIIYGSEDSITIYIEDLGEVDAPDINTPSNQTIETDENFTIDWDPVTVPNGNAVTYNVYVLDEDGNNRCVNSSKITGTSYTIDKSYFKTPGDYVISVIAMAKDYVQSDDDDAAINLTVIEKEEEPELFQISLSSNPVRVAEYFTITVKANSATKGVAFYVDNEIYIGETYKTSASDTYVFTYYFNKTGKENSTNKEDVTNTRIIYAYPINEDGDVVSDATLVYSSVTVNPARYKFNDFSVHAAQTKIDKPVTITWDKVSSKNGATVYYNLWIDGELVAEDLTKNSYTLTVNEVKKIGVGSYGTMVMAMADEHRQKQANGGLTIYRTGDIYPGDVNGDDEINALDVTKLRKYLANTDSTVIPKDVSATQGADVNKDGKINGKDLTALLVMLEKGSIPMPEPEPEPVIPVEPNTPNDRDPNAEYTFWMPLELATMPAVSQLEVLSNLHNIYLLPMYGYTAIQGYDITNQKKVSLKTAGIVFDETSDTGNVTVDKYGTICARKTGYGWLGYKQEIDGQWIEKRIFIHVGNRSSSENIPAPYLYSDIDYQYISMALDLNFTAYRADMPTQYADVDMSMGSIIIDSVANVGQFMEWTLQRILQGKIGNIESALLQQSLSKFITEYSDEICNIDDSEIVAQNTAATEFVMFFFDVILDGAHDIESIANDIKDILGYDSWKAVKASYDAVKSTGGSVEDIKSLFEFFHKMMFHNEMNKVITQSLNFTNRLKALGLSWDSIKFLAKDMLYFCKDEVVHKFIKAFKKGTNYLGLALDGFEFLVYVSSDFSNNIRVLETLRGQLINYYNKDCVEIQAIDSLIWQYQNKILEGALVWISKAGTGAVMTLSHPIVAITTFAFSIIGDAYKVEEKRDITIMVLYVCALNKTLYACDEMYYKGKQLISLDALRFNAAMYFNLILRQSDLALKVATTEDRVKIEKEIQEIKTLFADYLTYQMPKTST